MKSLQSLLRKRTLNKIKVSTNNCLTLLRLLYFKQNKKIHYLSTPLPNTKITFDSHTQRNSMSEKLPPMFEYHYSNNDLVTNVEKSLTKKKKLFWGLLHQFIILLLLWELTYICNERQIVQKINQTVYIFYGTKQIINKILYFC